MNGTAVVAWVSLLVAGIALLLAIWAFIAACDALHKRGIPGPPGPMGPMGASGEPCDCDNKLTMDEAIRRVQWANDFERKDNAN